MDLDTDNGLKMQKELKHLVFENKGCGYTCANLYRNVTKFV